MDSSLLAKAIEVGSTKPGIAKPYKSLSMGQMGESICTLYFRYNNLEPVEDVPGQLSRIFSMGNAVEEILVKSIKIGLPIYDIQTQVRLESIPFDGMTRLNGYVDMVVSDNSSSHVLEFKSMNQNKFENFKSVDLKDFNLNYYGQVQLYMHIGKFNSPAFLVAMNKNNSAVAIKEIDYNKDFCNDLIKKAKYVIKMDHPFTVLKTCPYEIRCSTCDIKELCFNTR